MSRYLLNILSLLILSVAARAQAFNPDTLIARYLMFSEYLAPEKLYLHLDRTAYCAGETIWFSAYVKNASPLTIYEESNFIYVELIHPDGYVEKRVKVRRDGKSFPGHIYLNDDTEPGKYVIRAYTLAQLDIPAEYCFNQEVLIMGHQESERKRGESRDDTEIDVSFYPEGGRYFAGVPSRIGFKVMDSSGKSLDAEGRIVDDSGETVMPISTTHDGMGSFRFIPQPGNNYFCELESGRRYPLPGASSEGVSVSVQELSGRRVIAVCGLSGGIYSILIRDISQMRHLADYEADGRVRTFILPDDMLADGINHLILMDAGGRMAAERLFFKYPAKVINASLSCADTLTGKRMPVTMRLDLPGCDSAVCSMSVLRSSLSGCIQDDGIDSYMMLSSELRGNINQPRHYFDPGIPARQRSADMDLLMLIQGWTYYDLAQIADPDASLGGEKKRHFREYLQQVRGKVKRSFSSRTPEKFLMTFMIPSMGRTSITPVEEGRTFVIDSLDFEEGTGMIIKVTRLGKGMDYEPSWNGDEFAAEYKYFPAPGYVRSGREQVQIDYSDPADTLTAAYITAEKKTDLGINGREMPKLDMKTLSYMTLVDYVRMKAPFQYDGQLMRSQKVSLLSTGGEDNWDESPVQLVVNGSIAAWEAFADITLSELKNISISTQPDVLYKATQGVVAIQLDDGASVSMLGKSDASFVYFTPLGYQVPQQFYSPRYDKGYYDGNQDKRNTILWDPSVKVIGGHAEVTFCTSDEECWPYTVQVEGMTSGGEFFSANMLMTK